MNRPAQAISKSRACPGSVRLYFLGRGLTAVFLLLIALPLAAHSAPAGPETVRVPPEENYIYNIHFLFFQNAAVGSLKIRKVDKFRYRADLVAETKGFIGLVTGYRKNHYISEMEFVPREKRLISRVYSKTVYRGLSVTRSATTIDQKMRKIQWKTTENGALKDSGTEPIPEGVTYEDLLSAFFNLRFGAFGPLTRGRHLTVKTLPAYRTTEKGEEEYEKKFVRDFDIRIADEETERRYRERYERTKEKGLLALVKVPEELFGQKTGEVRVWLDENLIPVAATVEDAILFGDVHGTLERAVISRPKSAGDISR